MFGLDPTVVSGIVLAMVVGGLVKGTIGIGLPIASVAILSQFLEVPLVLALVTLPIVATNFWQAVQAGKLVEPLRRFWPMIACLLIFVWLSTKLVVELEPDLLYGLIGLTVAVFTVTSYVKPSRALSSTQERWAGPLAGTLGGFLGGISTIWGPPMTMYFIMIRLPKEEFIRAVGLVWFAGSVPLLLGYIDNGILTPRTAQMSMLAALPAFAGLWLGQRLRNLIPQETFRKVVLLALFVIGLNLIRRALF